MRDVANTSAKYTMCYTVQHIHIVNQRHRLTQGPNIRGALQSSTSKMLNVKRSSTQAPNIRGILQCSTSPLPFHVVVQH